MPIKTKINQNGNKTEKYLQKALTIMDLEKLKNIADESLKKFIRSSPTEEIANSWSYEIVSKGNKVSLFFNNSCVKDGVNIAIIIDIGHGTKNGYWVSGQNYLSKPIKETYDRIINETWEELKAYE
jgi:hypothetical protein